MVFPYNFRTDSARLRRNSALPTKPGQRNTKMAMLTSKSARARLAARREPYWVQIGRGSYLGFRAGADTWIVRHRDHDGQQQYRSLGEVEEFSDAKERADRWLAADRERRPPRAVARHRPRCPCELRAKPSLDRPPRDSLGRRAALPTYSWPNSEFGRMRLEDVRREDVEQWRDGLRRGRLPRTVNRQVRAVLRHSTLLCQNAGTSAPAKRGSLSIWSTMARKTSLSF